MERQILAFFIITFFALLIMIWLALYSWKRRPANCAGTLALLFLSISLWMAAILFGLVVRTEAASYIWSVFRMVGVFISPVFWLILALQYSNKVRRLGSVFYILLGIIPLFSLTLMITNNYHHLFLSSIIYERHGPFLVDAEWILGPWFPIHVAYSYSLVLIGNFFFFREAVKLASSYLGQAVSLILGASIPLLVNAAYVFHLFPGIVVNYDPLGFVIAGIIFSTGLFRFRFLDIIPVARRFLVDHMQDGLVVIDPGYRIIDINPEALRIFGAAGQDILGKEASDVLRLLPAEEYCRSRAVSELTMNGSVYEVRTSQLISGGDTLGYLLLIRDITRQKKMESRLRESAQTDPLTGILNRRHFFVLAGEEIARATRYRHPVSVIMIDCDLFKSINDSFGHQAGDQVLIELTRVCSDTIRDTDIFARYGGEEFIILSPETPAADAFLLAERLRKGIGDMDFRRDNIHIPITVSIGVASIDGEALSSGSALELVIEHADKALYAAKAEGRNRTHSYGNMKNRTTQS